jgi:flavin-dependent dehydrogenase
VECVDVAIVGGGPGGSAAALSLRAHAPSLSVVVIEASSYDTPRFGETLPPIGQRLLEHLGVWEAFQREPHQASYGTLAAWGSTAPHEQSFIYSPYGRGWHLDRRAFDAWLAMQAAARGAHVRRSTRVRRLDRVDRNGEGWRLVLDTQGEPREHRARFVVDATGAAAWIARADSAPSTAADHLVAFTCFFDAAGSATQTMVEAFSDGWWYTAPLPAGGRIVACFTDPDIARARRLAEPACFSRLLAEMPVVSEAVGDALPVGPIAARSVGSGCLERAAGDDWLAVGDAASMFDPLSSQGVLKALRSGVFASYAIGDWLVHGDRAGFDRYSRRVRDEFDAYLETRAKYYAQEQRWPDSPFWARRHGRVHLRRNLG